MKKLRIALAADHAGFQFKNELAEILKAEGYEVKDFGTNSEESMDYPDTAHPLAEAVEAGEFDFGFTLCLPQIITIDVCPFSFTPPQTLPGLT